MRTPRDGGRPLPEPLRAALTAAGLRSLSDLSTAVGLAPQTLRCIRANRAKRLTPFRRDRAADVLGVSPSVVERLVLGRDGPPP
jgi:hypothetical protein